MGLKNGGSRGWGRHMVNMGNVWDRTTEFLSDNLGAIMPITLLAICLPAIVIQTLIGAIAQIGFGTVYAVAALLALPALWGQLFLIGFALEPDAGGAAATRGATQAFGRALLVMLLLFVIWITLAVPIAIAFATSGMDMAALQAGSATALDGVSGATASFILCYAVALLVVIAFVSTRLMMLYPVIVAEGGIVSTLRRAFALSRGMFWRILGVMVLFVVVYLVAEAAVGSVFGLIFRLLAPDTGPFGVGPVVVAILTAMVRTAYTVLVSVFAAKLYRAAVAVRATVPAA